MLKKNRNCQDVQALLINLGVMRGGGGGGGGGVLVVVAHVRNPGNLRRSAVATLIELAPRS
jgi:hypothetical protein